MKDAGAFASATAFVLRFKRVLGVALFIAILVAIFDLTGLRENFNVTFLRSLILHHQLGGLVLFAFLFSLGNLIQIPGWVFLAAAVLTLGRTWGGIVTYAAAVTSCVLTFLIIRAVGGDALRLLENRIAVRLLRELDSRPIASVALLRTLFQTVPALNFALAMSGIRFRDYLIGTLIGLPLPIAVYCVFFDLLAMGLHLE